MKFKLLLGIVLLVPVLMFVQYNIEPVAIRFYKWEQSAPLSLLLLGALVIGILLGMMLSFFRRRRKAKKQKLADEKKAAEARKKAAQAEQKEVVSEEPTTVNLKEVPPAEPKETTETSP